MLIDKQFLQYKDLLTNPQFAALDSLARSNYDPEAKTPRSAPLSLAGEKAGVTQAVLMRWLDDKLFLEVLEARKEAITHFLMDRLTTIAQVNDALSLSAISHLKDFYRPETNVKYQVQQLNNQFQLDLTAKKTEQAEELLKSLPTVSFKIDDNDFAFVTELMNAIPNRPVSPVIKRKGRPRKVDAESD